MSSEETLRPGASIPQDARAEQRLWFVTLPQTFWSASANGDPRRLPAWPEGPSAERISEHVQLYEPLLAINVESGALECVGYFFTRGYRVRDGVTADVCRTLPLDGKLRLDELAARHPIPKTWLAEVLAPGSVTPLPLREAFTLVQGTSLWGPLAHQLREIDRLGQLENAREAVYALLAEQGCSKEESHEVFAGLDTLMGLATRRPKPSPAIDEQMGTLIHVLHAGDLPAEQWSKLWDRLVGAWKTYHIVALAADGASPREHSVAEAPSGQRAQSAPTAAADTPSAR